MFFIKFWIEEVSLYFWFTNSWYLSTMNMKCIRFCQIFFHINFCDCMTIFLAYWCGELQWLFFEYWNSIHTSTRSHLVWGYNSIYTLIDFICYYFVEVFCIDVYERYCPIVCLFCNVLYDSSIKLMLASQNVLGSSTWASVFKEEI